MSKNHRLLHSFWRTRDYSTNLNEANRPHRIRPCFCWFVSGKVVGGRYWICHPLVKKHSRLEYPKFLKGNISSKGPFYIAMLDYRSVYHCCPPKPTFLEGFMVNNLVFRWPKPLFFLVVGVTLRKLLTISQQVQSPFFIGRFTKLHFH